MSKDDYSQDELASFPQSTPDLSPNLSDTPIPEHEAMGINPHINVGQIPMEQHYPRSGEPEATQAEALRAGHEYTSSVIKEVAFENQNLEKKIADLQTTKYVLQFLYDDIKDPEARREAYKEIEDARLAVLYKLRFYEESRNRMLTKTSSANDGYRENIRYSREHLMNNREAYENEAVNDYNRARSADPDRYPDPLTYGEDFQQPEKPTE